MADNFEIRMDEYLPLRDVVFNTLRQAILKGELKPGERLMEIQLANKLGVSRTPVREAIRKLELEGLVLMIPRKGAEVAEITRQDMEDVLEVRTALEELAVKDACDHITDAQLSELKKMLPVQLERASALMREAERRLESAQTQSNAIVASAQSRAADMIKDANEQAQFLAGQENVTELARQKARAILDQAQTRADHLTQGADQYCTTVMEGLSQQLGKLSQDVQAGLNVLEERQRAAREQMPHLTLNDYPEAQ